MNAYGVTHALHLHTAPPGVGEPIDSAGHQDDPVARKHLARTGERAQPSRQIQRTAAEASLDRYRLTGIQADSDVHWQRRIFARRIGEAPLKRNRRSQGLTWRVEHAESLVAAQLRHSTSRLADAIAHERRESGRE